MMALLGPARGRRDWSDAVRDGSIAVAGDPDLVGRVAAWSAPPPSKRRRRTSAADITARRGGSGKVVAFPTDATRVAFCV
jgi:hypothetical protein